MSVGRGVVVAVAAIVLTATPAFAAEDDDPTGSQTAMVIEVVVPEHVAASGNPTPDAATTPEAVPSGELATTGFDPASVLPWTLGALAAIGGGALAARARRRGDA
ncbi:MAG: hypothetical protein QM604_02145 [Microbacterium sp.]